MNFFKHLFLPSPLSVLKQRILFLIQGESRERQDNDDNLEKEEMKL